MINCHNSFIAIATDQFCCVVHESKKKGGGSSARYLVEDHSAITVQVGYSSLPN